MEFEELCNDELLEIDGGGKWGAAYSIAKGAGGAAIAGAGIGSCLGPAGTVAGAISFGLCGAGLAACEYILTSEF